MLCSTFACRIPHLHWECWNVYPRQQLLLALLSDLSHRQASSHMGRGAAAYHTPLNHGLCSNQGLCFRLPYLPWECESWWSVTHPMESEQLECGKQSENGPLSEPDSKYLQIREEFKEGKNSLWMNHRYQNLPTFQDVAVYQPETRKIREGIAPLHSQRFFTDRYQSTLPNRLVAQNTLLKRWKSQTLAYRKTAHQPEVLPRKNKGLLVPSHHPV